MQTALILLLLAAIILAAIKTRKKAEKKQHRFYTGDKADTFDLHGCRVQATVVGSTEDFAFIEFLDSRGAWNARKTPHHELTPSTLHLKPQP
jgi:hypothetical protein